ncbi:MAG: hypothetical protein CMC48_03105 [Flavobacteriaceae bacterium]|nr:hypothetical protein [Flavobacteriaceae bacterium]|tara:strand:+ start:199 stop:1500 length:1302 start_codon:yes stop_codon:yes gene_type:complete
MQQTIILIRLKLILFLLFLKISFAQNSTASPYSLGGLGDITFKGNVINRMMGGVSVFSDSIHANLNNPASLGELKLTTFSVGIHYKNTQLTSSDLRDDSRTGSLDYIAVSIPTKFFSFSFGVIPYSSVGYRLQANNLTKQDEVVVSRYEGRGGTNKSFFTVGFKILKFVSLGGTVNYNFGKISTQASSQNENIDFGTFLSSESSLSGLDYELGTHFKFNLSKKYIIESFLTFKPENNLNSRNKRVYFTRSLQNQNIGDFKEVDLISSNLDLVKLRIGQSYKYGLSISKDKKWFLGSQYSFAQSENFKNDFLNQGNISYENANSISFGGFIIPDFSSITDYWKRIVYRVGFRSENTGIKIDNSLLKERVYSIGASFPMGGYYSANNVSGFSNLNVGFELGTRGINSGSLIKENFWALRIGLSLNDLWFIKRKYN